jgi:hypothetical protein
MDEFFGQLDKFLSGLTPSGFGSLAQDFHRREVISAEERKFVEERLSVSGRGGAKELLMLILKSKRDKATLKAISQALQAFNLLYKDTKGK